MWYCWARMLRGAPGPQQPGPDDPGSEPLDLNTKARKSRDPKQAKLGLLVRLLLLLGDSLVLWKPRALQ